MLAQKTRQPYYTLPLDHTIIVLSPSSQALRTPRTLISTHVRRTPRRSRSIRNRNIGEVVLADGFDRVRICINPSISIGILHFFGDIIPMAQGYEDNVQTAATKPRMATPVTALRMR